MRGEGKKKKNKKKKTNNNNMLEMKSKVVTSKLGFLLSIGYKLIRC